MELLGSHFGLARNESDRYHPRTAVGTPTLLRPVATYNQPYSRNWAFIPAELQERLAQTTLLCAGTGLGSMIALAAAQTGFQRFVLCDGDTVEEHNLNRQAFDRGQIGTNKAQAIGETLASLLPEARIEVVPRFLGSADFSELMPRADLIINTIDLDSPAFLELNRIAHQHGKTVLFPLNLGWAGALLVFDQHSQTLDEFIGIVSRHAEGAQVGTERVLGEAGQLIDLQAAKAKTAATSPAVATRLITRVLERLGDDVPSELEALVPLYERRTPETWPCDRELGSTAHVTAALTVRACVALVTGEPVRMAPEVILCDTSAAIAPSGHVVTTPEQEAESHGEEETLLEVSAAVRSEDAHRPEPFDVPHLAAFTTPSRNEAAELFVAHRAVDRTALRPREERVRCWSISVGAVTYSVQELDWSDTSMHLAYQQLRGEVFVGVRGWDLPLSQDGCEVDRYDIGGSQAIRVYVVLGDAGNGHRDLLGGVRVFQLRHWDDSMLTHEFRTAGMIPGEILDDLEERFEARQLVELTRLCVRPRRKRAPSDSSYLNTPPSYDLGIVRDLVYAGAFAGAETVGRRWAIGLADTPYLGVMKRSHFVFETLFEGGMHQRGGYGLVLIDLAATVRAIHMRGDSARADRMLLCCDRQRWLQRLEEELDGSVSSGR